MGEGAPLSQREKVVLRCMITRPEDNLVEIADGLCRSINTIKAQKKSLYKKLGVGNRADAVRVGAAYGRRRGESA